METIAPVVLAVIILVVIVDLLRRKKIREKYAALWLAVGAATMILGAFPQLLNIAAESMGVSVPSNLLFALGILFVLGVLLHLSVEISSVEDETRTLAEEVAILRTQLEALNRELPPPAGNGVIDGRRIPSVADDEAGRGCEDETGEFTIESPQ